MSYTEQSQIRILEQELIAVKAENRRLYDALARAESQREELLCQVNEASSDGFSTSFPSE